MNRTLIRVLLANFLLLFGLIYSVPISKLNQAPARRSLLSSFPENHDTALVAALDGGIHLVYRESGRVIWSFASGSPIYTSYQAPINHDDDKENASALGNSRYFVDCGDDWKLFAHTDLGKVNMDVSIEDFIRIMPHVSEDGGVILGSKTTKAFVVDAETGKLIRVHHSSPSKSPQSQSSLSTKETSIVKKENPDKQLSFTRTDYLLTSFAPNSNKVLWNVTVANIDVTLLCQEIPSSPFPHNKDLRPKFKSKSNVDFNMPLSCQSKSVVHRLRSNSFKPHSEYKLPFLLNEPLPSNSDKSSESPKSYPDSDFEIQPISFDSRKEDRFKIIVEGRIGFVIILILIVAIVFLMYRHHMVMMLKNNPDPKSSKSGRRRRSRKSYGNVEVDSEKGSPFDFNHLIPCGTEGRSIGKLFVSSKEIAKGSNGTIVVEGIYQGRKVAVKRLVRAHHDVAFKEVQNLIASDQHPNIVRWFGVEYDDDFVYLSLERCSCSLYDLIQMYSESQSDKLNYKSCFDSAVMSDIRLWRPNGYPSHMLLNLMRDMVSGLMHLHDLGIIHRDLKPHNVLIVKEKSLCAKLSDMGISRRLVGDMSSLGHHATGSGSSGWQAPEQLLLGRQTRAVDLFSLGCVLFYCITCGKHPFGDPLERDFNVVKNRVNLFLVEHIPEAVDLFLLLLNPIAELRPKVSEVLHHPLFWNSEMRMSFFRDTSDRVELEDREVDSIILRALESTAPVALGGKWDEKMEPAFINNIGKYRRYKYNSVRDLLRVIRNKLNHYRELPNEIQALLGSIPEGFDEYFGSRFPKLLMEVYNVMYHYCKQEEWFLKYLQH